MVINKIKGQFARHGIPNTVMSDNGPQFTSEKFQSFAQKWGFKTITSSPHYPQSNGKAESAVKTAKQILKKAKMDKKDPFLAMLNYRNTPTQGLDASPVQRLMNRRTRTNLPTSPKLLKPKVPRNQPKQMKAKRDKQKAYYDRNAKDLPALKVDDVVRVQPTQNHQNWTKAQVTKLIGYRSYVVRTKYNQVFRRNRRYLRKTNEPWSQSTEDMGGVGETGHQGTQMPVPERTTGGGQQENRQLEPDGEVADKTGVATRAASPHQKLQQQRTAAVVAGEQAHETTGGHAKTPGGKSTRTRRNIQAPARYGDYV